MKQKHYSTINGDTIPISGVWLRATGSRIQLLVEYNKEWRLVDDEPNLGLETVISSITEPEGINASPVEP